MRSSLEKQIYLLCPIIFRAQGNTPRNSPLNYGIECGDGWYDLIRQLSYSIEDIALAQKQSGTQKEKLPIVVQIKEKSGGLRFYVEHSNHMINELITEAEYNSFAICEICGKPGIKYTEIFIRTRCQDHKCIHPRFGVF